MKKYFAEFAGTFMLALAVAVSLGGHFPVPTPVIAGLTLGLCVYTIGGISGAHINPAITLGLLAIKKITLKDAFIYIVMQFAGGLMAMLASHALAPHDALEAATTGRVIVCELLGTFMLAFGVASVVHGKAPGEAAGLVIGGSLLMGISLAASGSNGVLNPAVALGIGSLSPAYVIGPVVGALAAMLVYRFLAE